MYLQTYTYLHIKTHIHTLTYTDTHLHNYIYLHTQTHTHTHTFWQLEPSSLPATIHLRLVPNETLQKSIPSKVLGIDTIQICLGSGRVSPSYTLLVGMQICLTFWRPLDNIHRNFQVHSNLLSEIYLIYMFHQPPKVQAQEYLLLHHLRENVIGAGVCIKKHQLFSRNDEYLFV